MSQLMQATNGIFQVEYALEKVTVRLFQSTELEVSDPTVFQAIITYKKEDGRTRQELDTLTNDQRDHCRKTARELEQKAGLKPFSDMFKAYMAQAYWGLIK